MLGRDLYFNFNFDLIFDLLLLFFDRRLLDVLLHSGLLYSEKVILMNFEFYFFPSRHGLILFHDNAKSCISQITETFRIDKILQFLRCLSDRFSPFQKFQIILAFENV